MGKFGKNLLTGFRDTRAKIGDFTLSVNNILFSMRVSGPMTHDHVS